MIVTRIEVSALVYKLHVCYAENGKEMQKGLDFWEPWDVDDGAQGVINDADIN